jgi:hypothetical protein
MRTHVTFEREGSEWYAVLPAYPGPKEDLQMILGADHLLYIIAQGASVVELIFDSEEYEGANLLRRKGLGWLGDREYEGATYWLADYNSVPYGFDVWLCDVTIFVFGELPGLIYFSCHSTKP